MKPDYECHITVEADESLTNFLEMEGRTTGWKTSFIAGDPDLGQGNRFFFTKHYSSLEDAKGGTERLARDLARNEGVGLKVVRKKIEHVLMDSRSGTWES